MKTDIFEAKRVGASGVVFGVLKADLTLSEFNKELVAYAKSLNLEVTFHRAFDFIKDYKKGVEQIIELGFDRLLTAGLQKTAEEGLEVINYLQANYGKQIQIMAGSGVNSLNALKMASSGINNLHFSAHKTLNTNELFSMGAQHVIDEQKIKTITMLF
jgi:copper homeostasis protein